MPIFYKITASNGKQSHMLGTLHLSDSEVNRFSKEQVEAFQRSSILLVEGIIGTSQEELNSWESKHRTTHDNWLSDPANLAHKVRQIAKKNPFFVPHFFIAALVKQLPPMDLAKIVAQFTITNIVNSILDSGDCLDNALYRLAIKTGKTIKGLENTNAPDPLTSASFLTYPQQLRIAEYYLDRFSYQAFRQKFKQAKLEYLSGHVQEDHEVIENKDKIQEVSLYNKAFLGDRDVVMARELQAHLDSGNVFIAIGAMHLPGIAKILRENGYQVDGIQITERKYPVVDYYTRNAFSISITQGLFMLGVIQFALALHFRSNTLFTTGLLFEAGVLISALSLMHDYITTPAWPKTSIRAELTSNSSFFTKRESNIAPPPKSDGPHMKLT